MKALKKQSKQISQLQLKAQDSRLNAGFTLIEALVSVSIVAISVVGITLLFVSTSILNKETRDRQTASKIAQNKIDSLRNSPFSSLRTLAEDQLSAEPESEPVPELNTGFLKAYVTPIDTDGGGVAEDDEDADGTVVDSDESGDEDEPIFEVTVVTSFKNKEGEMKNETIVSHISENGL